MVSASDALARESLLLTLGVRFEDEADAPRVEPDLVRRYCEGNLSPAERQLVDGYCSRFRSWFLAVATFGLPGDGAPCV